MTLKLSGDGYGWAGVSYVYKQAVKPVSHPCECLVYEHGYFFSHAPEGMAGRFCGKPTTVGYVCHECEKRHNVYLCSTHFNLHHDPKNEAYINTAMREDFPELLNE